MATFRLDKELLEAIGTFFRRPAIGGVFMLYALLLVGLNYVQLDIPAFVDYFVLISLDLYLVGMVVAHFKVDTALNFLQKRLFAYIMFFFLLNLISAPLLLAIIAYFYWVPDIFAIVLVVLLALGYFYAIFIRIYFLAPIMLLSKEKNPWVAVKKAWKRGRKHQEFLLKVGVVGIIFYLLSIGAPFLIKNSFLRTGLIIFFSGISLPIVKILFVSAGMHVLKR
jgi:hypothetical protein